MPRRTILEFAPSVPMFIAYLLLAGAGLAADIPIDLHDHRPESGISVTSADSRLVVGWPIDEDEYGRLVIDLREGHPLIERFVLAARPDEEGTAVVSAVDPAYFVTVGSRRGDPTRPPRMSEFNVFFDSPAQRPHQTHRSRLELRDARVFSRGRSTTVALGRLSAGPFVGELQFTVYPHARLIHVEAVLTTQEPSRAFFYDTGLVGGDPPAARITWMDTEGKFKRVPFAADADDTPLAVRHRAILAETDRGTLACLPPPHQYFFPRDFTDNLKYAWYGRDHAGLDTRPGFGIRQTATGGGRFSPWYSAPPGTEQRLGVFYLLGRGPAEETLAEVLRYTHGDRFPDLTGHVTMTSHWHMAIAVAAMKEIAEQGGDRSTPDFVSMFKAMNVDIVHLGEFHGDGHPQDSGPLRLPELEAMFAECRRLSDDDLLMLPGEEANVHFGPESKDVPPGHWMSLFPRPVFWIMRRQPDEPFVTDHPTYGKLYRVGNAEEMTRLLRAEGGLAWTAHARIKSSNWAPDSYRDRDFFSDPTWLGAAWKAMPADLAEPRLGGRVLGLLDDMANWGGRKHVLGEVDVFKLDHTHELYGHMNVNYLRLDRAPRYDEGWSAVSDALRHGRFFTTTGEVLITRFDVGGQPSGEVLGLPADGRPELVVGLDWTFPPRFAEVISGDGRQVYRERIDLTDREAFGSTALTFRPDLTGRTWVRVEAWDVAANGAFTQAVWLDPAAPKP